MCVWPEPNADGSVGCGAGRPSGAQLREGCELSAVPVRCGVNSTRTGARRSEGVPWAESRSERRAVGHGARLPPRAGPQEDASWGVIFAPRRPNLLTPLDALEAQDLKSKFPCKCPSKLPFKLQCKSSFNVYFK